MYKKLKDFFKKVFSHNNVCSTETEQKLKSPEIFISQHDIEVANMKLKAAKTYSLAVTTEVEAANVEGDAVKKENENLDQKIKNNKKRERILKTTGALSKKESSLIMKQLKAGISPQKVFNIQ